MVQQRENRMRDNTKSAAKKNVSTMRDIILGTIAGVAQIPAPNNG
jgi:hypothetical protein